MCITVPSKEKVFKNQKDQNLKEASFELLSQTCCSYILLKLVVGKVTKEGTVHTIKN